MVSAQKREKLSTLLHSLETEDRKWLQQKLMRQDTASLLRDEKGLSDQELLAAESWYWQQYAESTSMRARRAHARLWCIFMLLRYGGLRLVEALALELGHMDWGSGIIHIQGEHARQVPLPATHCRRLRQMMEDPALFTPSGALLHCDASYVRRSLQQCGNACGLPAGLLSARSLRQTRILELVRQGLPAPVADMFAGRNRRQQSGSIRYNLKAAQTLLREHVQRTSGLRTSARNVFHGRIEHLRASGIIVTVVLCTAGGLRVTAMITDESCKSLGLSKDMLVTASIKAPWIIIEPDQGQDKPPVTTRNCFRGTVERVRQDEMLAEILVNLPDGSQACALHVRGESPIPPVSSSVWVIFKALSVILTLD